MKVFMRLAKVMDATGMSRSTLYRRVRQGLVPTPVKLGERSAAWPKHEIAAINAARLAGKSDAEIRSLVAKLQRQRLTAV